jgi:hypothetical protein
MTGPYFESWSHENLVKFAKEAYEKLQAQERELQELRLPRAGMRNGRTEFMPPPSAQEDKFY